MEALAGLDHRRSWDRIVYRAADSSVHIGWNGDGRRRVYGIRHGRTLRRLGPLHAGQSSEALGRMDSGALERAADCEPVCHWLFGRCRRRVHRLDHWRIRDPARRLSAPHAPTPSSHGPLAAPCALAHLALAERGHKARARPPPGFMTWHRRANYERGPTALRERIGRSNGVTAIGWMTILRGRWPTGILASTLPPRRSISDTSLDCSFVTYANWLSDVAAIQCGIAPNFTSLVFL